MGALLGGNWRPHHVTWRMPMEIGLDSVMLLLHLLFFCYWLGTDLGVFHSATYMLKADLGVEARQYCRKILTFLDQAPRVSMPGILATGSTVGILRGYIQLDTAWIVPIWIVGLIWIGAVLYLYLNEHHPEKIKTVRTIDFNFRLVMIAFLAIISIASLLGVQTGISDKWLAAKVLVFAGTMICGVLTRIMMKDFGPHFGPMMKGTATPEQVATAQAMMARAKIPVLTIWGLLVVAAAMGLWKPF
jgi:hypothetical protein